jgi:hypothetical protein
MSIVIGIIVVILVLANIIFHCVGIYLLVLLMRNRGQTVGSMCILNLCCTKLVVIFLILCYLLMSIIGAKESSVVINEIQYHIRLINFCLLATVLFLTMVLTMITKLLEITMNVRYTTFWNEKKTKVLIMAIWICAACFCLCTMFAYHFYGFRFERIYLSFIHLPACLLYVIFAVASNIYVLYKLNQSRMTPYGATTTSNRPLSFWNVFRKSRFIVPVLLTFTFIIFQVSSAIIFTLDNIIKNKKTSRNIKFYYLISINIIMLCNSFISIFLEPQIKQLVRRMPRNRRERLDVELSQRRRTDVVNTQRQHIDVNDIYVIQENSETRTTHM